MTPRNGTDDDDFRKLSKNNNYTGIKKPLYFYFSSFCDVIYKHLLRKRVYVTVSS